MILCFCQSSVDLAWVVLHAVADDVALSAPPQHNDYKVALLC